MRSRLSAVVPVPLVHQLLLLLVASSAWAQPYDHVRASAIDPLLQLHRISSSDDYQGRGIWIAVTVAVKVPRIAGLRLPC